MNANLALQQAPPCFRHSHCLGSFDLQTVSAPHHLTIHLWEEGFFSNKYDLLGKLFVNVNLRGQEYDSYDLGCRPAQPAIREKR